MAVFGAPVPETSSQPLDIENLLAGEAERLNGVVGPELQRQNAHADEIRAMDSFITLCDDRTNPLKIRTLGGPIPA